jgi:uncharacterized membrane protein
MTTARREGFTGAMATRGTYDQRQINAKLVVCAVCGKPSYFTDHNQKVHVACSQRP